MSAIMPRQGDQVQLIQSNMLQALNEAEMAKGGFACAVEFETQYLNKKSRAEVWEQKQGEVCIPGRWMGKAAIERHLTMVCENHMDGCLPWQQGTATNLHTPWIYKGTGAPPPDRLRPVLSTVPNRHNSSKFGLEP